MKGEQHGMGKFPSCVPTHPIVLTLLALKDELFSLGNCTQALFEETKIEVAGLNALANTAAHLLYLMCRAPSSLLAVPLRTRSLHHHPSTSPAMLQAETRELRTLTGLFPLAHR